MTARQVMTAQREAAQRIVQATVAPQVTEARVSWGELGCPKETGLYRAVDAPRQLQAGDVQGGDVQESVLVWVKRIHIIAAENNPQALFTVLAFEPPLGPAEYVLGHRVA